jgi:predicted nucleic acid-binding protein
MSCENRLGVCISDADVLVKLCRTGNLSILKDAFGKIMIGPTVEHEAKRKIGTHGKGISLFQATREGWLEIIDINGLPPEKKQTIKLFCKSYEAYLDPGELEAAALATELGVFCILSDDRNAKRCIEEFTDSKGIAHWEILSILVEQGTLPEDEAEKIFDTINITRTHPITIPFKDLHIKSLHRLRNLKLI